MVSSRKGPTPSQTVSFAGGDHAVPMQGMWRGSPPVWTFGSRIAGDRVCGLRGESPSPAAPRSCPRYVRVVTGGDWPGTSRDAGDHLLACGELRGLEMSIQYLRSLIREREVASQELDRLPPCGCRTCRSGWPCERGGLANIRKVDELDQAIIAERGRLALAILDLLAQSGERLCDTAPCTQPGHLCAIAHELTSFMREAEPEPFSDGDEPTPSPDPVPSVPP